MTREAVEAGFERFVDDVVEETVAEFSVARALRRGVRGPGGQVVDRLLKNSRALRRRVVDPELDRYRARAVRQFGVVLDAVESDEPFDAHADAIIRTDSYWQSLRPDVDDERRARIREHLLDRNRRLAGAVAPLVASPADDFWAAATDALDREAAIDLVESSFAFTEPLVAHRDAFVMRTSFDPGDVIGGVGGLLAGGLPTVEVEFTDEAIRAMRRAERTVVAETTREVRRRFDAA